MTILPWKKLALMNLEIKRSIEDINVSDLEFAIQIFPGDNHKKMSLAIMIRKIISDDCGIKKEQIDATCPAKTLETLMQCTSFSGWIWGGFLWNGYDYDRVRMRLWDYIDTACGYKTPHILTSDKLTFLLAFSQLNTPEFTCNPSFGNWVRLVVEEVDHILRESKICLPDEKCTAIIDSPSC